MDYLLKKENRNALAVFALSVLMYVAEKAVKRLANWSETLALLQAMIFTLLCLAVILLLFKVKNVYCGILCGALAIRYLPPKLEMLQVLLPDAYAFYYAVRAAFFLIALYLVYRLYASQKGKKEVALVPVAAMVFAQPFLKKIVTRYSEFSFGKTGSMMGTYILAAAEIAALGALYLALAFYYKGRGKSSEIVCDFGFITFTLAMLRKLTSALILGIAGAHISKAYFCLALAFAVFAAALFIVRQKIVKSAKSKV